MARTPLLDMLQRAVRQHARSEFEGRPLRQRQAGLKRRDVLRGGAGLALASIVPATGLAATARIAIVGAGLAGLTAARELRKANLVTDLFEGNTRIGGRCYTARDFFNDGQIAEHGGEFIDSDHTDILTLARELDLTVDDVLKATPKGTHELYFFNGKPYDLAAASRDWAPLQPVVKQQSIDVGDYDYSSSTPAARRFDAMTITQWVSTYVPGGRTSQLGKLIENALTEENGADPDQQSALSVIGALSDNKRHKFNLYYNESDQRFHVHGGNDQIPTLVSKGLGDKVETGTALVAIARLSDGRLRLSLKRDGAITDRIYDRVILALPFSLMRTMVDYRSAGFQPLKQRAIQTLPIGASTKFQMQFTRRAWNEAGCNGEARVPSQAFQTTWEVSRAQPGDSGILNYFSGGTRALNAGKTDNVTLANEVLDNLAPVLPMLGKYPNGLMIKDAWKTNPWSLGSYSYYQPGYATTLLGIEAVPEGNCFFAGEHTAEQNGFLNAAVSTGIRAAKEVIASLK